MEKGLFCLGVQGQARRPTNLYNQRPTWPDLAHQRLDQAMLAAYGWPEDLGEEGILERLLALNLKQASAEGAGGRDIGCA